MMPQIPTGIPAKMWANMGEFAFDFTVDEKHLSGQDIFQIGTTNVFVFDAADNLRFTYLFVAQANFD